MSSIHKVKNARDMCNLLYFAWFLWRVGFSLEFSEVVEDDSQIGFRYRKLGCT